jgi:hypothetical protein
MNLNLNNRFLNLNNILLNLNNILLNFVEKIQLKNKLPELNNIAPIDPILLPKKPEIIEPRGAKKIINKYIFL